MTMLLQGLQMGLQPALVAGSHPAGLTRRRASVQCQVHGGRLIEQLFFQQTLKHGAQTLLAPALHIQSQRQGDGMPGQLSCGDDGGDLGRAARSRQQGRRSLAAALNALAIVAEDVEIFRGGVGVLRRQLY